MTDSDFTVCMELTTTKHKASPQGGSHGEDINTIPREALRKLVGSNKLDEGNRNAHCAELRAKCAEDLVPQEKLLSQVQRSDLT